ncbi:MAG: YeeE/YedE thiosulfate transporter family protein [Pseudorhodoplanes sp.]|uniref:YeeE/YedE thiosulfate transporter family protein n=1 Tax=Pseudorhodoplanes sp. TaxID=1934341 RepID=UPI003D0C9905
MSLVTAILIGLLMGAVFGIALEKSRVFEPGVIVGQMQLRNFIMLKVFLTAVATGAVVLAVLNGFGLVKLAPKATLYGADIVGGLILGMGIALAGACPGTVMAQIGAGYRDAIVTLIGGIGGAVAYSYAEPGLSKTFLGASNGKLVLSSLLGIPFWVGALGLAILCVGILVVLERLFPSDRELGANVDGDLAPRDRAVPRSVAVAR